MRELSLCVEAIPVIHSKENEAHKLTSLSVVTSTRCMPLIACSTECVGCAGQCEWRHVRCLGPGEVWDHAQQGGCLGGMQLLLRQASGTGGTLCCRVKLQVLGTQRVVNFASHKPSILNPRAVSPGWALQEQ